MHDHKEFLWRWRPFTNGGATSGAAALQCPSEPMTLVHCIALDNEARGCLSPDLMEADTVPVVAP
eukprot:19088-Eustigmatos_ZCMA.PRE.1